EGATARHQCLENMTDLKLMVRVGETRWRCHDDFSVAVGFDASLQPLPERVGANLLPATEMKRGRVLDARDVQQAGHEAKRRAGASELQPETRTWRRAGTFCGQLNRPVRRPLTCFHPPSARPRRPPERRTQYPRCPAYP